jgi:uncharacterized membrane protein YdfJ with MMPL/SSD domain
MEKRNVAARAAHWSASHRKTVIFGWLAFVVVAVMVGNMVGQNKIHGADQFSGESARAEHALENNGLRPNTEDVLFQSSTLTIKDLEFRQAINEASDGLSQTKNVVNVQSPLTGGDVPVSADGHSALVEFEITGNSLEAEDRVAPSETVVENVQDLHPEMTVEQFGDVSTEKELNDIFSSDLAKAEGLSFPLTLLILVVAFGTLVAALVPLLLAATSVMAAMALVNIPSQISPVDGNLSSVILLVGLAVGVDYSLFYVRRERQERAAGRDSRSALEVAAATSGRAVLISGLTVIAAMSGMFLTGDKTFISFAQGTILVVAIAIVASLTVLPGILAWLGDRIEKGRIPFLGRAGGRGDSRAWSAIVDRVMRRPWLSIVLAGGFLIALAVPALNMKIVQTSPDDLPQDLQLIKTYNQVRDAFPTEGVTADVVVEAPDVRDTQVQAAMSLLQRRAEGSAYANGQSEITYSANDKVAKISIPTKGNGNDNESNAALAQLRDREIPATLGQVPGTTVNVSGDAAESKDFSDLVNSRLPLIFAFVFALTFLLMLFTFRSIVVPIKAIILNLLSVGAAYGVLVLVFQDGRLEGLLGYNSNGGVTSWLPLFLFVILFGLSMDYHVFILSRVRELVDRGSTTEEAVRKGISSTAGTVTSAAVVMVVVFGVFATLSFLDFKEMGIGLATAVLIDATIIRGVLLPASMKVLGEWNWYLPSWLGWIPERHAASELPVPDAVPEPAPARP